MSSFSDALTSIISGGATGILGSALSRVFGFFENKQKFKHDLELLRINGELQEKESAARLKEIQLQGDMTVRNAEVQGEINMELSANEMLGKSYTEAGTRWSSGDSKYLIMVDVVRGMTRPLLTITLCLMAFTIWLSTKDLKLETQIVMTLLYLTTTSVLWWFGTRPAGKTGRFNG